MPDPTTPREGRRLVSLDTGQPIVFASPSEPEIASRQDVPEPPDGRPTADRAAVERARNDGGTRALIARALWRRETAPTTGAQTMGYVYELADRVASQALPEIERRGHLLNPPDVPPDLVIRAAKASSLHFENCDFGDSWQDCQDCRRAYDRAHYALAAVVAEIERQIRERVAVELEALRDGVVNKHTPYNEAFMHGVDCAIRAARGES